MKKIKFAVVMVLILSMHMGSTAFAATATGGSAKGVTTLEEWSSVDDYGHMFVFVKIRNDNNVNCSVYMNAVSLNSSGTKIEEVSSSAVYMVPGETYALVASFEKSAKATNYDYELVVDKSLDVNDYIPAGDCINASFADDGKGTVDIYASNSSAYTIEAEAIVVFYMKDQVVDFGAVALTNDSDLLLSPGEKTTEYISTDVSYDASELLCTAIR